MDAYLCRVCGFFGKSGLIFNFFMSKVEIGHLLVVWQLTMITFFLLTELGTIIEE